MGEFVKFVFASFMLMGALTWFYLFCNVGQLLTSRYGAIEEVLNDCLYNLLCQEGIRKYLPVLFQNAQRPVRMRGLMNIECTRETFMKVIIITDKLLFKILIFFNFLLLIDHKGSLCILQFSESSLIIYSIKLT